MNDLVEYTKWMSNQCSEMRARVRKAEKVISDLKTSGEESVDKLMETLFILKMKVEESEAEADKMRAIINAKEETIAAQEAEKANIKQRIEIDNADRENEIQHLRRQLAEQKELMDGQRKLMNELQALCEFT